MLQEMPKEANIIVVGAGLSGLELVSELLKCGIPNVVLLESGSYDRIAHTNSYLTPRESFTFWQSPELDPDFYQPWRSDSTPHYCGLSGLRRGIGGRSRYWRGITLRMDDWALEDPIWPVGIRHDLERSWKGNIGLYEEVEKDLACWARRDLSAFRGIEEKILVDFLSHTLDSPCLPVPLARQYSLTKTGKKWCAYTPISRWMEFGGNLESNTSPCIVSNCNVEEIVLDNNKAFGVQFKRQEVTEREIIKGDIIVLAAAALENARLVAQTIIKAGKNHPPFWGLYDHIKQGFMVKIPCSKLITSCLPEGFAFIQGNSENKSNTFIEVESSLSQEYILLDAWSIGEQSYSASSIIKFSSSSGNTLKACVSVAESNMDNLVIAAQRSDLQSLWKKLRYAFNIPGTDLVFDNFWHSAKPADQAYSQILASDNFNPITYCCPLGSVDHESGSTPVGDITTEDGGVINIPNLFVVGPSTFPRAGAANPSLTILALARRTAHKIVDSIK